ncbi:hypothetical protein CcaverHIS002_0111370 [Cutaneotrichosporon cavernicola]|uniref:Smr domain-containing protein n=1 Tax=Cutaneotrichosporon cavernicola TaxID=279322 RepID=A0AA48I2K0_9TREE|nr:uncharacterized protein CcaverHIS019_0111270 [Cutaneotrichosporon cavernicola]BEI80608.1 hypothetical protein CcaverHIS002_0111370 [Cutaneotrichosporon cavernicola]BEI88409.1 hypothetical protein CcaverHIS019_0111270 [Cutaneotrichosporon cavernicola]BEI96182.1 hypothetical protein CcaverHIS631_0111310 [Cutaneotrichosporon cavernicola]BEJ03953.1 hypothetical protein CcaverHIS641_0111280 [Cutaneotrichosporon cavernicola]
MGKNQRKKGPLRKEPAPTPLSVPAPRQWQPSKDLASKDIDLGVLESVLHVDFPLLDSALISAMVQDYANDGMLAANEAVLRDQLAALEAHVVADAADEADNDPAPSQSLPSETDSLPVDKLSVSLSRTSRFAPSQAPTPSGTSSFPSLSSHPSSGSASRSITDDDDLESEKDFLAALFPSLLAKDIATALAVEHSLEDAVDHLLSIEAIRESQRSWSWGDKSPEEVGKSEVVMRRGSSSSGRSGTGTETPVSASTPVPATKVKKKKKKKTIPIVDTLQRRPQQPRSPIARPTPSNIWATLSSVAAYLSDILPHTHWQWFQTYLHSPDYMSAYEAVLASLKQLSLTSGVPPSPEVVDVLEEVFGPQDELVYCIGAAAGDTAIALDLMNLLTDLRTWDDYEAASTERDPYHVLAGFTSRSRPTSGSSSPAPSLPATPNPSTQSTRALNANRLTRPPPKETKEKTIADRPIPGSAAVSTNFQPIHEANQPSNSNFGGQRSQPKPNSAVNVAWSGTSKKRAASANATVTPGPRGLGTVTVRTTENAAPPSKANGNDSRANGSAKAGSRPSAAASHFTRADEWDEKRKHAVHRATADYNAAPKHLRGQVIGAYRLQAREAAAQVHVHRLAGARAVLDEQRSHSPNTIDLHLRTVAESTTLALEAVEAWYSEGGRGHFRVITGQGRHSVGQRGVIGPAVANALRGAGWRVEVHPGYLTVKGR